MATMGVLWQSPFFCFVMLNPCLKFMSQSHLVLKLHQILLELDLTGNSENKESYKLFFTNNWR